MVQDVIEFAIKSSPHRIYLKNISDMLITLVHSILGF